MKKSKKSKPRKKSTGVQQRFEQLHSRAAGLCNADLKEAREEKNRILARRMLQLSAMVDKLMAKDNDLAPEKAKEQAAEELDKQLLNTSGITVDSVLFTTYTEELASSIHELEQLEGDRKEKIALLKKLEESMDDGVIGIQVVIVKLDGVYYRVNGKHTSALYMNKSYLFESVPQAIVVFYDVETLEDAVVIFSKYDYRPSSRISNEIYRVHAKSVPALRRANVPDWAVAACVNGMAMFDHGKRWDTVSPYERARTYIATQTQFILWVFHNLLSGLSAGKGAYANLTCASVMAEIFGAYHANGDKLSELRIFFRNVRDGVQRKKSPAQHLHKVLKKSKVAAVKLQKEIEELHNHQQRRCLVRVALNIHLSGKKVPSYKTYLELCIDGELPEYLDAD